VHIQPIDNIYNRFFVQATRATEKAAVIVQDGDVLHTWTYGDLLKLGANLSTWLAQTGVESGQSCAILSENQPLWCAAYLGILHHGAVAVPLDTNQSCAALALMLSDSNAKVLFASRSQMEKAREAAKQLPVRVELLDIDKERTASGPFADGPTPAPVPQPSPVSSSDVALLLYTSGTTSSPKGVLLTHGNLLAVLDGLVEAIPISGHDRGLAVLPLFHILAQLTTLLVPLSVGGTVVMISDLNATELLRALQERQITVFCCVPQFFYLIHKRILQQVSRSWFRKQLFRALLRVNGFLRRLGPNLGRQMFRQVHTTLGSEMSFFITGGSRFDPHIAKDFYDLGFDLLQGYGLTECGGNATLTRIGNRKFDSVGYPVGKSEIKIVANDRSADGEGEIAIRGPNVMLGYQNRADLTAEVIKDRWLLTGDLGRLDSSGQLTITGRQKEIIVLSSGKNIYPDELEKHYQHSPFLKEICVVPRNSQSGGASTIRLHAVVVPDMELMQVKQIPDIQLRIRYEMDNQSVLLPSYERVSSFQLSNTPLPRTTTGKLKRHEIQALVTESPAREAKSWSDEALTWSTRPEVQKALQIIQAQTARVNVHPTDRLDLELDQDSLGRVELIIQVAEAFNASVPDEAVARIHTVRDLVDVVLEATNDKPTGPPAQTDQPWQQLLSADATSNLGQRYMDSRASWSTVLLFAASRAAGLIARILLRLRVDGQQSLNDGPLLICPNHQTYFDGILVAAAIPWRIFRIMYFVGSPYYFSQPWLKWLARRLNIVLLDTESNVREAMRVCAAGLWNGKVFLIFPEGERTIDGSVGTFLKGSSILSLHTGAPIVPVGISGAFEVWPRARGFQKLNRVRIRFGPALHPEGQPAKIAAAEAERFYQRQTDLLRKQVESLMID
jgi:long-chain acyl-CoA synthetase